MHQFTMSLYSKPHTYSVHVCLAVTCCLHFRQNDRVLLRATAVTRGGTDAKMRAQNVDTGEEYSPAASAGA